jgi:glycosyltransferase involved in cell wall biosynthesis
MKNLLWVGDAGVSTGFARCTHEILRSVSRNYNVSVLGINYAGRPHSWPYPIYPAWQPRGDAFGVREIAEVAFRTRAELIVIQQDPWNFPPYLDELKKYEELKGIPVVGVVAVDGLNCRGKALQGLRLAIFWTAFGLREAHQGGYRGHACVIPLGVDLKQYFPMDRTFARRELGLPAGFANKFIIGVVGRNQLRKRLDLTMQYFADLVHTRDADAYLYLHVAPTGDRDGFDLEQLTRYYRLEGRVIHVCPPMGDGVSEDVMRLTYNAFNVLLSTSQGEGWWLPGIEAMACQVPVVAGDWAAPGEWIERGGRLIECTTNAMTPGGINVIGGIPDKEQTVNVLHDLYKNPVAYQSLAEDALKLAQEDRFRWPGIGQQYVDALDIALTDLAPKEAVSA